MKQVIILVLLMTVYVMGAFAQKETFDVVSYVLPKGWKKEVKENGVQIYTGNEKTGEYSMGLIIKSTSAEGPASKNFVALWEKLVKGTVTVSGEPVMAAPSKGKGWEIVSGQANYTDGGNKGVVTLVTATGGGKVAAVVLMANTDKYQSELQGFLGSLEMSEVAAAGSGGGLSSGAAGPVDISSVVGIWESNMLETSGMRFANGSPMLTAGYFRKAYTFRPDGTYQFLEKDFSVYSKNIFFAYETGTWAIDGNQLTVTPGSGKNESWSKSASGGTKEWGSLLETTVRKLEKVSYTFEFRYFSGMKETDLLLKYEKSTERDGSQGSNGAWYYKPASAPGQSIIDAPPGKKIPGGRADGKGGGVGR
ncbi:MAG TPA: lipocalin family protein [Puia sp.]